MIQDSGNKLEAKTDDLQQTLCKEIQYLKLKQEEMQNAVTEIKIFIRRSQQQNTRGRRMNK